MKRVQLISGLIFNTIIMLVIAKLSTGSLNPFEVFSGDSVFLKILMGFLMVVMGLNLLTLALVGRLKDKRCAGTGCGKPLVEFAGALGGPLRCRFCGRWFHSRCFKANGGSTMEGCRQPGCSSAPVQDSFSDDF